MFVLSTLAAPTQNPPGGSGAIQSLGTGEVGIGTAAIVGQSLTIGGNIQVAGAINATGNITVGGLCLGGVCNTTWPSGGGNPYYNSLQSGTATNYNKLTCPSGKKVIGGGCRSLANCLMQYSYPDNADHSWNCGFNPSTNCGAKAYVICL